VRFSLNLPKQLHRCVQALASCDSGHHQVIWILSDALSKWCVLSHDPEHVGTARRGRGDSYGDSGRNLASGGEEAGSPNPR
jgi:hypothetical protein